MARPPQLAKLMRDPLFAKGYKLRRAVMGADNVDKDQAQRLDDAFQRPMWELGIRGCYGLVWSRPGLTKRERSIATLSAMVALHTLDELKVHTRNAVNNGLTSAEISEVLLHAAVYCGYPKAVSAFKAARTVLDEPAVKARAAQNARARRKPKAERR